MCFYTFSPFEVGLGTFQALNSVVWLVTTSLHSIGIIYV